jgi:hypothetical protein
MDDKRLGLVWEEPSPVEKARYSAWMERHREALGRAYEAAETLSRAYDRAAVVTAADDNPDLPFELEWEIAVLYQRWSELRWAGRRRQSENYSR